MIVAASWSGSSAVRSAAVVELEPAPVDDLRRCWRLDGPHRAGRHEHRRRRIDPRPVALLALSASGVHMQRGSNQKAEDGLNVLDVGNAVEINLGRFEPDPDANSAKGMCSGKEEQGNRR